MDPVPAPPVRFGVEGRPPGGRLVIGLELNLVIMGIAFVASAGAAVVAVRPGGAVLATVAAGRQLLDQVGLQAFG